MQVINKEKFNNVMNSEVIKLNLGCGNDILSDYLNIDANPEVSGDLDVVSDITVLSFCKDDSVDEILSYHSIEHLGHHKAQNFLKECYRILKQNGKLIIETPNLSELIEQFSKFRDTQHDDIKGDFGDGSIYESIYGGQNDTGSYHLACFTRWQLRFILNKVGFIKIVDEIPTRCISDKFGINWNIRMVCKK